LRDIFEFNISQNLVILLYFFSVLEGFICSYYQKTGALSRVKNISELPIFTGVHTKKNSLT